MTTIYNDKIVKEPKKVVYHHNHDCVKCGEPLYQPQGDHTHPRNMGREFGLPQTCVRCAIRVYTGQEIQWIGHAETKDLYWTQWNRENKGGGELK